VGKQKMKIEVRIPLSVLLVRKWKMKIEFRIPFSDGVGKQKMKLEVQILFFYVVGKWLALRYTHSNYPTGNNILYK